MKVRTNSKTIVAIYSTRSTQTLTEKNTTWRRSGDNRAQAFRALDQARYPTRPGPSIQETILLPHEFCCWTKLEERMHFISFFSQVMFFRPACRAKGSTPKKQQEQQEQGTPFDENIFWWRSKMGFRVYDEDRDGVLNLAEESAWRNYYFPTSATTKTKWNFVLLLEKIETPKLQQQPRREDPGRLVLNQQPVVVPCCLCGSTCVEHETRKLFSNLCRERQRQRTSRDF